MNGKFRNSWENLRSSFWFLPSIMATVAAVLAFVILAIERPLANTVVQIPFVYTGGADGTRGLLSAIASSSITVAGTTFSITIAVLTLASSTYGSRVLRTFTRNMGNQVVLGTFVATFVYSLIVLRAVRSPGENLGGGSAADPGFVPHLSTTVAIGLAIADIAVLIYFIHHITVSIQASTIIAEVGQDLQEAIDHMYPQGIGEGAAANGERQGAADVPPWERDSVPIKATGSGYIQTIDDEQVLKLSSEHNVVVQIRHRPGTFVVKGNELLRVWPSTRVNDELQEHINDAFAFGKQRTLTQDVEFGVWQLVDVAIRALSPSLNDPYTAVNCLDQLSIGLCDLADREFPSRYRYDEYNRLRVVANPVTFERLLDVAFDEIRQNGNQFVMVLNKLLDIIGLLATRVRSTDALAALRQHGHLIEQASRDGISSEHDRRKVERQYADTVRAISEREMAFQ